MAARRIWMRMAPAGILMAAITLAFPVSSPAEFRTGVEIDAGYRVDSLAWDIGGGAAGPNVISELTWKNLHVLEVQARARAENEYHFYAKGMLSYGWIIHGRNQDSDYDGDNRTQEFSRSNNGANGAYVWDGSFGLGYAVHPTEAWSIIPLMGASISTQKVVMKEGYQTIGDGVRVPLPGPISGLNSSYKAEWWGPWNGVDVEYSQGRLRLAAGAEYHWSVAYSGSGNWNLRGLTFTDNAWHGHGYVASGSLGYVLNERWTLRGEGKWRDFTVDRGVAATSVGPVTTGLQPFNHAHWSSISGSVGAEYRF